MSNHHRRRRARPGRVPGGCDDCHAYQTVTTAPRVVHITVHHDPTCPRFQALNPRRTS